VLHDRRQRHAKRLRKRAHRKSGLIGKTRHQRPPRRIGERGKGAVKWGAVILNHVVKYRATVLAVKLRAASERAIRARIDVKRATARLPSRQSELKALHQGDGQGRDREKTKCLFANSECELRKKLP
jgi:hypothetical protein